LKDPLSHIKINSKFIRETRLTFDIVVKDDIINISFTLLPSRGKPWYGYHRSRRYGSGMIPLTNVDGKEKATPLAVARALCEKLKAGKPKAVKNIRRNYVDLYIPKFIKLSQAQPNCPERSTKIERVVGHVLFADLRGFSSWALTTEPEHVSELYEVISGRVAQMAVDCPFDYWKLLGDGIMLVWVTNERRESDTVDIALGAAYELHKKYWYYKREESYEVPDGFGIAVCSGHMTKISSAEFFESCIVTDYLGPIVNQAARLQTLAQPGEVLVNKRVAKASKFDWYSFEDVTGKLSKKIKKLKGYSPYEIKTFRVKHRYFNSDWSKFCCF